MKQILSTKFWPFRASYSTATEFLDQQKLCLPMFLVPSLANSEITTFHNSLKNALLCLLVKESIIRKEEKKKAFAQRRKGLCGQWDTGYSSTGQVSFPCLFDETQLHCNRWLNFACCGWWCHSLSTSLWDCLLTQQAAFCGGLVALLKYIYLTSRL